MNEQLWQNYQHATTYPDTAHNAEVLTDLAHRLDTPELADDDDRRLLVHVYGSLALLAGDPAQSGQHLADAERVADAITDVAARDLSFFVITEIAVRAGNPEVAVRSAPRVTAEGMASQGRQDLYEDTQDYLAQARAGLQDPALSAALSAVQEELRIDPDLGVPFSDQEMREALAAQTDTDD